jgi:hypothetical protein
MKLPALVFTLVLLSTAFAGCLEEGGSVFSGKSKKVGRDVLSALPVLDLKPGQALWNDPQNTPHPAYNFPTLSSPAIGEGVPRFWKPIDAAALPAAIAGIDLLAPTPAGTVRGAGIAIFGSLAIVPGYGKNTTIVDISSPAKPVVLSQFMPQEGMTNHRGATTIAYPEGRLVTVISTGRGLDVWDITDPYSPQPLPAIPMRSHKVGVVPGTPIVYNAPSNGGNADLAQATGVTPIYDLSDPTNPRFVQNFTNGFGCHHVYFWNNVAQNKFRAICAGIEYAQIWDTADPLDPKVIVSVPMPHGNQDLQSLSDAPQAPWAHFAGLSEDGTILLVGDENGGGGSPPGCVASANTPAGAVSTPIGALWFYDVSTETDPKVLGWYSPLNDPRIKPTPTTSCTAHHGRLVPVEGRDVIAMSFYGAGVILVDFTDIEIGTLPHVIDQFAQGSNTWETWYNQGYLFTGDLNRGMDVLKFV